MKKHTIEDAQNIATIKGGHCLSTKYINSKTKMLWKCKAGHTWEAIFDSICRNTWCPVCAGNKHLALTNAIELAKSKNGICLSDEYINKDSIMHWRCNDNHEWFASYNNVKRGTWCPFCFGNARHTLYDAQNIANERNGKCLSDTYINSKELMLWECKVGHQWTTSFGCINNGTWCPMCAGKAKHTLYDAQILAQKNNGTCISTTYVDVFTKMLWKCNKNHIWEACYHNIDCGKWCPECSAYKTQRHIAEEAASILNEPYEFNYHPDWLRNPKTGRKLEIDIYFTQSKIAIEYQGIQHFEPHDFSGHMTKEEMDKEFKDLKVRDKIKAKILKKSEHVSHFIVFDYKEDITKSNILNKLGSIL